MRYTDTDAHKKRKRNGEKENTLTSLFKYRTLYIDNLTGSKSVYLMPMPYRVQLLLIFQFDCFCYRITAENVYSTALCLLRYHVYWNGATFNSRLVAKIPTSICNQRFNQDLNHAGELLTIFTGCDNGRLEFFFLLF